MAVRGGTRAEATRQPYALPRSDLCLRHIGSWLPAAHLHAAHDADVKPARHAAGLPSVGAAGLRAAITSHASIQQGRPQPRAPATTGTRPPPPPALTQTACRPWPTPAPPPARRWSCGLHQGQRFTSAMSNTRPRFCPACPPQARQGSGGAHNGSQPIGHATRYQVRHHPDSDLLPHGPARACVVCHASARLGGAATAADERRALLQRLFLAAIIPLAEDHEA